jgi:adenylylsulfate kinase-like enzyme
VIIWLNGTFGAGKTTTALALAGMMPNARVFDAETVGYLLMATLQDHEFSDFQDLPPWRALVPVVTSEIARFTGQHLLVTQSVLNETYWTELQQGLNEHALDVFHIVLHADPETLAQRITADQQDPRARQWRLDHIAGYLAAQNWMEAAADLMIDTTALPVLEVASSIVQAVLAARPTVGMTCTRGRLGDQVTPGGTAPGPRSAVIHRSGRR